MGKFGKILWLLAVGLMFASLTVNAATPQTGALRAPLNQLPQASNFVLVGANPLVNPPGSRMSARDIPRGMNAALGIARNCAYVGSRNGLQDVLIVDISNPRNPVVTGSIIPGIALSSSRELKVIEDLDMLVIGNFQLAPGPTGENPTTTPGVVNNFRIYNIADCKKPALQSEFDLGASVFHEFFSGGIRRIPGEFLPTCRFLGARTSRTSGSST